MRPNHNEEKMEEDVCDSCGKEEKNSKGGLYQYTCRICRDTYILCDTCSTIVNKEQKCIECLNDGK